MPHTQLPVVTGIGLVSALGTNLEDSWQQLIAGKSGIKLHQPFPDLEPRPLGLIGKQPVELRMLTKLVVASALKDALLVPPLPDCGVVIGSSRSHQASWEEMARERGGQGDKGDKGDKEDCLEKFLPCLPPLPCPPIPPSPHPPLSPSPPPLSWLDTLPHMNAIAVARQIGATGIVLAPMAACATGIWAIAQAVLLIQTGQCQRVIVGAVEAPITPLTITGFQQMGASAKTGAYPFDKHREGLVLGEGAAVFVLESRELAKQRQAKIYGQILGFGLTADAYHGYELEPEGRSAIACVKQCLERSHLTFSDIDYIHAHGTATQMNDRIESMVIQRLFPQNVAVSSTKGATGHSLGASGALGVAFSLMALKNQILPPCVGLKEAEFDLDFVTTAREAEIRQVLCLSFGFGGQNAAIALAKES
ncbi:beta-ketoacyl-ACP synthase [Hassallia byssoidea VB512170]|uniref:Beta-ketoacyl-ACP synthase n=1 Tax=Hassallia byssoidea VB512170 TaxID=1304833 RepID=A0A846H8Y9_9CYAN|nr:beta-ketoacyl-ACP synthase [Hassalia byssoidea]NEU73060.1 beta-ketoacyl-ACP synthase [Hassalia byssoidea VB512170]